MKIFMKIVLLLHTIFLMFIHSNAQIIHNDPFKINNLLYLEIEFLNQEIIKNNIKSIEKQYYKINSKGKKKGKDRPISKINFNISGLPSSFSKIEIMDVWWLHKLNPPKYFYDYYFNYDSMNRLVSVLELIKENKNSQDERDYLLSYNNLGNVSKIDYIDKHIYKDGYKYRGVLLINDTTIKQTTLHYDSNIIVKTLIGETYYSFDRTIAFDTLDVYTTFDSLFISPNTSNNIKKDSLGNIIEVKIYKRLGKSIGGENMYSDSKIEYIYKYYYERNNLLIKSELYNYNNLLINSKTFNYHKNGLINSIQIKVFNENKEVKSSIIEYKYTYW